MRHSDIFEEFAKIAQERGLISKADPDEIRRKLEDDPRIDSLDISAIEALYGIKPDTPKDMEYKRNIIEDAHPNAVVVSPSYDKLNGLVENLNERQDILMNIVQKMPDGHVTQRKYAEQQLLLSLVRLGNDLDNQNKEELRILADVCLEQTASLKKKAELISTAAFPFLLVAGTIAATLGALYIQQKLPFINEGFRGNNKKLIAEIDDILNDSAGLFTGTTYSSNFLEEMRKLRKHVMDIYDTYEKIVPVINTLQRTRTASELLQLAKSPESSIVIRSYELFKTVVDENATLINQATENLSSQTYQAEQIEDKGYLNKFVDKTQILEGGKGLIANDFEDIVRAFPPYKASLQYILIILYRAKSIEANAKRQIDKAATENNTIINEPSTVPEGAGPMPEKTPESVRKSTEEMASKLEEELSGLKFAL